MTRRGEEDVLQVSVPDIQPAQGGKRGAFVALSKFEWGVRG
jgi:hypothetical protein